MIKIKNKISKAIHGLDLNDPKTDRESLERSGKYLRGLQMIINLIEDIKYFPKQGQGLKILTSKQMLSRLSVLLAQVHAGNNSVKLKNAIRQQLYSLYSETV